MKNFTILIFSISLVLISACSNSEKNTDFDKGPMLENLAFNLAVPAYENSLNSFRKLDSVISLMQKAPTEGNLQICRDMWAIAAKDWAQTAPFNFGPIDELLIENNFYYFPIDTAKLQSALEKYSAQDISISSLGSNISGLGALEYLLFSENGSSHSNANPFAKMLSENLVKLNKEVLTKWKSVYAKTFASSTGSNINSSITILANQWIEMVEKIKNNKIGIPSGQTAGSKQNFLAAQAPYSQNSLALVKENLLAFQRSFNGGDGKGVDDYLAALDIRDENNQLLSDKINSLIDQLVQLLNKQTLSDLIENDHEKIDHIYLETLNLTILLKTEMMSQLGLITTFSDSDGD